MKCVDFFTFEAHDKNNTKMKNGTSERNEQMKTLYENGNILTMETWPMAQALVEEDGVIRFVGTREIKTRL